MATMRAAILCGGAGSRLWPLSNDEAPKQFHALVGEKSLLAETVARSLRIPGLSRPMIITAERFAAEARRHCLDGGAADGCFILEPAPKNTAPAAALAALNALEDDADAVLVLLPSDHHIEDTASFVRAVESARALAEKGYFVTIGIRPESAETGYGYIKAGAALDDGFAVDRFVEKPVKAAAEAMLAEGGYFWNAGIFVFRAATFMDELRRYRPDIAAQAEAAWAARSEDGANVVPGLAAWTDCPSDSIDYAVGEKTSRAAVVPASMGWSDVGSWRSLMDLARADGDGNAKFGAAATLEAQGCYVRSSSRKVVVIGAQDLIVVETPDAVLIVHKDATQQVKQASALFKAGQGMAEAAE